MQPFYGYLQPMVNKHKQKKKIQAQQKEQQASKGSNWKQIPKVSQKEEKKRAPTLKAYFWRRGWKECLKRGRKRREWIYLVFQFRMKYSLGRIICYMFKYL